jgi:2-oxoglutarate dehydrogenase E1 component
MDKYSFLNSAHTSYFAELYEQYIEAPDTVEPSWRAFFQGFDFGVESGTPLDEVAEIEIPESVKKEFQVINLIDGYRTRGHLFTKTNPVRDRRGFTIPT